MAMLPKPPPKADVRTLRRYIDALTDVVNALQNQRVELHGADVRVAVYDAAGNQIATGNGTASATGRLDVNPGLGSVLVIE